MIKDIDLLDLMENIVETSGWSKARARNNPSMPDGFIISKSASCRVVFVGDGAVYKLERNPSQNLTEAEMAKVADDLIRNSNMAHLFYVPRTELLETSSGSPVVKQERIIGQHPDEFLGFSEYTGAASMEDRNAFDSILIELDDALAGLGLYIDDLHNYNVMIMADGRIALNDLGFSE